MKFDIFEEMTDQQAQAFLAEFLRSESKTIKLLLQECSNHGIPSDYSVISVIPFIRWVITYLTVVSKSADRELPDWIKNSESYMQNLFDFTGPSKKLILGAAYYLGEAFVRSYPCLRWAVGNAETAVKHMPVVSGFRSGLEMAPIMIVENIVRRVIIDSSKINDIDRAIAAWSERSK